MPDGVVAMIDAIWFLARSFRACLVLVMLPQQFILVLLHGVSLWHVLHRKSLVVTLNSVLVLPQCLQR